MVRRCTRVCILQHSKQVGSLDAPCVTTDRPVMTDFGVICRMYAFDVHSNSYFPLFLLLYGEPLPVLP